MSSSSSEDDTLCWHNVGRSTHESIDSSSLYVDRIDPDSDAWERSDNRKLKLSIDTADTVGETDKSEAMSQEETDDSMEDIIDSDEIGLLAT